MSMLMADGRCYDSPWKPGENPAGYLPQRAIALYA
jgi:hypothetical protein